MAKELRLYINNTQFNDWVSSDPVKESADADGVVPTLSFEITATMNNVNIPLIPVGGMEVMFYEHDTVTPSQHVYYFGGRIEIVESTPTPSNQVYSITCAGFDKQLDKHVAHIEFSQATYPNDSARVTRLFTEVPLPGIWDATSQVASGGFISYPTNSLSGYHKLDFKTILSQIAAETGQATDADYPVAPRRWFIEATWTNPASPTTSTITKVLHYYSATKVAVSFFPLTDQPSGIANFVYDSFLRNNSLSSLGVATESAHTWVPILGTWGVSTNTAALVADSGLQNMAYIESLLSDCTPEVTFSVKVGLQRLAFRIESLPATGYKWEGFIVQNESGTGYSLYRYQGGSFTQIGSTYAVTPANGDVLKAVLLGTSIQVYLNGSLIISGTSSFNQTSTKHGIAMQGANFAGRWDNFKVAASGAKTYADAKRTLDYSAIINAVPIQGPGSDPIIVSLLNAVGVQNTSGLIEKTYNPSGWQANHTYNAGDVIQPSANKKNGRHYRCSIAGISHATIEPTWTTTEESTIVDGTVTWTVDTWSAGGRSNQTITSDGGWVGAIASRSYLGDDPMTKPDNTVSMGKATIGGDWAPSTGAIWGILSNKAYCSVSSGGDNWAYLDVGASDGVLQVTLDTWVDKQRVMVRYRDLTHLLFLEARTIANGGWKFYSRNGGTDTLLGTYAGANPANGDIVKIRMVENWDPVAGNNYTAYTIYINNISRITYNDTTSLWGGYTQHGFGVPNTGATTARFTNFSFTHIQGARAFGLNTTDGNQGWKELLYSIRLNVDFSYGIYESSVLKFSGTWAEDDIFRIEVKKVSIPGGSPDAQYQVNYYQTGTTGLVLKYTSATIPTPDVTPMFLDTSFFHRGTAWASSTIRKYTYKIYLNQASIDAYGYRWSKLITDETLDSETLRQARADAIFGRHAQPRQTISVSLIDRYLRGSRVLFNSVKWSLDSDPRVVSSIDVDWGKYENLNYPGRTLVLGDSEREYGDDEPLGYLIRGRTSVQIDLDVPTGLSVDRGSRTSQNRVTHIASWNQQAPIIQFVEGELVRVGAGYQPQPYVWSGDRTSGEIPDLVPDTLYDLKIRVRDWNNNVSQYGPTVRFRSYRFVPPTPPSSVVESSNVYVPALNQALVTWTWTPSTDPTAVTQALYVSINNTAFRYSLNNNTTATFTLAMAGSAPYTFFVVAINQYMEEGAQSNTVTSTAAARRFYAQPYNLGFEIPDLYDPTLPDSFTRTVTGSNTIVLNTTNSYRGAYCLRLIHAGVASTTCIAKSALSPADFPGGSGTFHYEFWAKSTTSVSRLNVSFNYYAQDGTSLIYSSAFSPFATTSSWTKYSGTGIVLSAPGIFWGQVQIDLVDAASGATVYVDEILWGYQIDTPKVEDGAITGAKMETLWAGGTFSNATVIVDSKGRVTSASSGTAPVTNVIGTAPIASSGGTTPTISHNNSGVTIGTYTNATVTVDKTGHVTSASNGTAPVTTVTGTSPIVSSGGTTPAISLATSGVSAATYLWPTVTYDVYGRATTVVARAGTAFPGSPSNNDYFYRTDLGVLCQYISSITSWVGDRIYYDMLSPTTIRPVFSATATTYAEATPPDTASYYFEKVSWRGIVATTNNITNYWTLRVYCVGFTLGGTVLLDSNTSAKTAGTAFEIPGTGFGFQPLNMNSAQQLLFGIEIRKDNGTPGNFTLYGCNIAIREVYT